MQKVFVNGMVITMDEERPTAEAVLIENNSIRQVGTKDEVLQGAKPGAKIIDLKGRTLMPGFMDAHGHFITTAMAQLSFVDVRCSPIGVITNIAQMIEVLKNSQQAKRGKGAIIGYGYDETLSEDGRLAEAVDLDKVSLDRPVIVIHASFHLIMANTAAMRVAGVKPSKNITEGGTARRRIGKNAGIFEEMPTARGIKKLTYRSDIMVKLLLGIGKISESYLKNGVTTICEGANGNDNARIVKLAMNTGRFPGRYILCPALTSDGRVPPRIKGKFILNGPIKLFVDGNIQDYTAALSKPYATKPNTKTTNIPNTKTPNIPSTKETNNSILKTINDLNGIASKDARDIAEIDHKGSVRMSVDELREKLETLLNSSRSFAIHCSGDLALDKVIEAMEGCYNLNRNYYKRNLIIHCQTVREEQLDKMKALHLYPSFFPAHIYVWGDKHYSTYLGQERAERIAPVKSAVDRSIVFSLHNDSPVTVTNPLELVWNAVTRKTSGERILGKDQCVTVEDALKGITIHAAYQYKLDAILGSITVGKRADFVVLDKNPLQVHPDQLPTIRVQRVWIEGKLVWSDSVKKR